MTSLEELLEHARAHPMTEEEREAQIRNFGEANASFPKRPNRYVEEALVAYAACWSVAAPKKGGGRWFSVECGRGYSWYPRGSIELVIRGVVMVGLDREKWRDVGYQKLVDPALLEAHPDLHWILLAEGLREVARAMMAEWVGTPLTWG